MKYSPQPTARLRLALLATVLTSWLSASHVAASPLRNSAIVRAVQAARPSVVNIHGHKTITATTAGYAAGEQPRKVNGMGTGVVIDQRGYIITNYHVVEGVRQIQVSLYDGQAFVARLIAHDPQTDLAIIKIPTKRKLPLISVGTSQDLMEGEEVIAVGNAYGYENTVTRGIISALHRTVEVTDSQQYEDLIQTDASINPGNSGGPLLNIDGEMIGVNVAVRVGAQGIGFAIPVDRALEVAARLLSAERVGGVWHGIVPRTRPLNSSGVYAESIQPDSPASQAGLQTGDLVTRVNSLAVQRSLDLERAMIGLRPGQQVELEFVRDGRVQRVSVQLTAAQGEAAEPQDPIYQKAWEVFGMRLEELPPGSLSASGTQFSGGLRVLEVRTGSPAQREGVVAGDVLVGLHEWVTASRSDLAYVMSANQVQQSDGVRFYVLRGQETLFGHLPVAWQR
jgi:serine protease Do